MSFVGGGSDLASFYEKSEGAVVSVTIDKFMYVWVNDKFDDGIRISYSQTENITEVAQIKHPVVREALRMNNITGGVVISSIADIPSEGTGLGSSSAYAVGLLNALHVFKKEYASAEDLAREACKIEISILKEPIGKQDQYASAYGGFNFIRFHCDGRVSVDPIICLKETRKRLEKNILMLYTGRTRSASNILKDQKKNTEKKADKFKIMQKMVRLAHNLREELQKNNLDSFGEILHENWELKKQMAGGISDPQIDQWYEIGRKYGAVGGKILGAGGGGFLILYAPEEKHAQIIRALPELKPIDFEFEYQGSKIIFIH
jgi:D-glycero-alpha-D-manno-heptose-7-phosphate kinase